MKFFDPFWKASFYTGHHAKSFWRAFGRIVLVNFVLSVIFAGVFYFTIGKNIPSYLSSYGSRAVEGYPDNLAITLKNGQLSKNISGKLQLYPIAGSQNKEGPHYFVTIDESKDASIGNFNESDAYVFLARDGFLVKNDSGVRADTYGKMGEGNKEVVFTKDVLLKGVNFINQYSHFIPWIIPIVIVVFYTIFISIMYLFLVLFIGLIVMWLSKWIIKRKAGYSESYILSMYALAPAVIIDQILINLPYISVVASKIPFFTTLTVIFFLSLMFRKSLNHTNDHKSVE